MILYHKKERKAINKSKQTCVLKQAVIYFIYKQKESAYSRKTVRKDAFGMCNWDKRKQLPVLRTAAAL